VVDVGDGADRLLDGVGDGLLDVLDVGAGVDRADRDHGEVDVREEVDRHAGERGGAEHHDGQRGHQDRDGVPHGEEG
jgi:hypothetical protein